MTRLTARDLRPDPLELHDHHAHGRITKRAFLGHAAKFAVTGMTATGLLGALGPNDARARQVSDTDPDILANYLTYASPLGHGEVRGYLVLPAKVAGKVPGVVVAHEDQGLTPHIEDVARRVAKAGFIALAPDGLTAVGGYPGNDEAGRELQSKVDPEKLMNDFFAAVEFLMADPRTTGNVGITGFGYGGGVANAAAVAFPELGAAVPFYGQQAAAIDVPKIQAPILLHYAGLDARINEGWPPYEAALREYGKTYEAHVYPEANHGFHDDTTPRYDPTAADLAWQRTIDWFNRYLT